MWAAFQAAAPSAAAGTFSASKKGSVVGSYSTVCSAGCAGACVAFRLLRRVHAVPLSGPNNGHLSLPDPSQPLTQPHMLPAQVPALPKVSSEELLPCLQSVLSFPRGNAAPCAQAEERQGLAEVGIDPQRADAVERAVQGTDVGRGQQARRYQA